MNDVNWNDPAARLSRLLAPVLALALGLTLAGCGDDARTNVPPSLRTNAEDTTFPESTPGSHPAGHLAPAATPRPETREDKAREAVLSYLVNRPFSTGEFATQALSGAALELFLTDTEDVFFSTTKEKSRNLPELFAELFNDPSAVRVGKEDDGTLSVDTYEMRQSPNKWTLFASKKDNLKVGPDQRFSFPYRAGIYSVSARELYDFIHNRVIYGGYMNVQTEKSEHELPVVYANHGAFVSVDDEPSLQRFTAQLLRDLPKGEDERELRIQRLLNFVSTEIAYDFEVATAETEQLARPNEVLMLRRGDCSNKVILLASLLEQVHEPYLLAYVPHHICVVVQRGRFRDENRLAFRWRDATWTVIETTSPGFRIGLDRLQDPSLFAQMEYLQDPHDRAAIVSMKTGRRLAFR